MTSDTSEVHLPAVDEHHRKEVARKLQTSRLRRSNDLITLPELHLADWRPTNDVSLYIDVRGLTTRRLHQNGATFQIDFDFVDHALLVRTHDGRSRSFELADGIAVADFDARLHAPCTSTARSSARFDSRRHRHGTSGGT
jgi:hypothetical protein